MESVPVDFVAKLEAYLHHLETWDPVTFCVGGGSLAVLLILRRYVPRVPGALVVVVVASVVVAVFGLQVSTIGSRFGGIPRTLPVPQLPSLSFELVRELIPDATTIALLTAIEAVLP